jgi:magnesium transporter
METTTRLILPEVREALRTDPRQLAELIEELHPADLADLTVALEPELAQKLLRVMPVSAAARLLEQLRDEQRSELFAAFSAEEPDRAAAITDEMAPDERADLFSGLPTELRSRLLGLVGAEESRDIRTLLAYPEDSAGALMTTQFVALPANVTTGQAIDLMRQHAAEMETIYQAYAVDPHNTLLGAVSLRDLVTSPALRTIDEIMNPSIVTVAISDDQEEVARVFAKYDLLAVPVVDDSHRIVGIITVDDVMDVVEEEATEDAQRMGAVEPLEMPYVSTPFWHLVRARAPWLVVLFFGELFTRNVLEHYHSIDLAAIAMLTWFVPLVASAGGNSGSQSATLVIRALAVGRLHTSQAARILGRELLVGLMLGLIVSIVGVLSVVAWESSRTVSMVLTVAVAVVAVVTWGSLLGSGVPLLLYRCRIDPAVASTPFIASLMDVSGLVIYFEISRLFLQ